MLAYDNFQSNLMSKEQLPPQPQDDLLPQILSNPRRASKALAGLGVETDQVEGLLRDARRASEVLASLILANLQPFDENSARDDRVQEQASRDPLVCVVGVGFVGEILLKEFGSVFPAIGFDISESRLAEIKDDFTALKGVRLSSSQSILKEATHFCISVPTLLKPDWSVDTRHLESAIDMVTSHARPGSTIVIESSVSVGMTRQLLGAYTDRYFCGMSPERVDPGRTVPAAHDIPKVISALTPKALERMQDVYSKTFRTVVPVSKPEVAEMTKLFENCYRMINIAYVNEIADACQKANIDVHELVDAAATKPFGFQAFRPGLGVGGHCIPINPFYLMANNDLPLLRSATKATWDRPYALAREFYAAKKSALRGAEPRTLVVGVCFKPGQKVVDCSPGVAFASELKALGSKDLAFYDPLVEQSRVPWLRKLETAEFEAAKIDAAFDAVAVCSRQENVAWRELENLSKASVKWF